MLSATVLIVGSGPIGLWLAFELRRSNLDVLVIDTIPGRDKRSKYSKGLSVSAGSLETFASRGIADLFLKSGTVLHKAHFGGLPTQLDLNSAVLGAQYPYNLVIPQARTEDIILDLCEKIGVRFAWGVQFRALVQDEKTVLITTRRSTENGHGEDVELQIEATWVIGCDGTHSQVREFAGITFEGTPSTLSSAIADLQLTTKPPAAILIGRGLKEGSLLVPLGDGVHHRFVSSLKGALKTPISREPTLNEIKAEIQDAFGSDYGAHSPLWISRVGNACRTASSFRIGRVFLAGDAGHQLFPAGGQGMNLGFQDATSLAWRLAMVEQGSLLSKDVVERILGSYSVERRRAAQAVMHNIQAQIAIMTAASAPEIALRDIFCEALAMPHINAMWARRVTGFGEPTAAYINSLPALGESANGSGSEGVQMDSLVGSRITSRICGDVMEELFQSTTAEKFVLLLRQEITEKYQRNGEDDLGVVFKLWMDRLTVLPVTLPTIGDEWENIGALLVRPDMRIVWVARAELERAEISSSLATVLKWWFGVREEGEVGREVSQT